MKKMLQRQQGSALTEFAVIAIVLVPMLSFAPLLAKISDVNQTTIQASRYAAWERTLAPDAVKTDEKLSTEVNNRFFSLPDEAIKTEQGLLGGEKNQNSFWAVQGGQDRLFKSGGSDSRVATVNEKIPGTAAGTVSQQVSRIGNAMAGFMSDAVWDLENDGLYTARIGVNIGSNTLFAGDETEDCGNKKNEKVFNCLKRHNSILADGWGASGPEQVKQRVKSLVPANVLDPIANLAQVVGTLPVFKEFKKFDEEAIGYVAPDVLPLDRYSQ